MFDLIANMANWDTNTWAVVMVFGVPIVALITTAWVRIERARSDNELKRSMVERGMSVEEIERVMALKSNEK